MSYLSANAISAGYGSRNVIDNISFQLEEHCLMGVLGANGSGKTTLLKALCGILPHKGSCTLDHTVLEQLSVKALAGLVSYIPQRSGISIDISALDVVLMGFNPRLGLLEHPSPEMKAAAVRALTRTGLAGKEETNYQQLSEGQKQLCILARTLVSDSRLLILDEPESALDFRHRHQMLSLLRNWVTSGPRCALVALHDPALALNCCDRLLLLNEGGVLAVIEPGTTPPDEMEQALCAVYGNISVQRCYNKSGRAQLVLLREDDV